MVIDTLRAETPGCLDRIHLNNAGAALPPQPVLKVVLDHLELEARIGGYEAELQLTDALQQVYVSLARLLSANPHEIALTQNATRAWDMIFYALPLKPGDRILTCRAEYASNYIAFLQRCQLTGAEVIVADNDDDGAVSIESLRSHLDERVKLVAINHVPTNGGLIQPAQAIGQLLADHPAIYLLDACQSVGQIELDVNQLGCDALSATSRKFLRGPRGVGFLYVRDSLIERLIPPMLDLHSATWVSPDTYRVQANASRFETYESFVAGRLGLGAAADYALNLGLKSIQERACGLAQRARQGLRSLGAQVHDLGKDQAAIVTFSLDGVDPTWLIEHLHSLNINIWSCTANSARLDMEARGLTRVLRVSPHYYNTENEIDSFLHAIEAL